MASQRRRDAIAAGLPVESAEAYRRRTRQEAAIAREELAIQLYARGATRQEISDRLLAEFGVALRGDILALVRRGLYRRVQEGSATQEEARQALAASYRELLEVWMPRALGIGAPLDDGNPPAPDRLAAETVLKILDKWGMIHGAVAPPRSGDINLNVINMPADADRQRAAILESLAVDAAKQREIEGALAGTPATVTEHPAALDGKIMPPIPAAPQERPQP